MSAMFLLSRSSRMVAARSPAVGVAARCSSRGFSVSSVRALKESERDGDHEKHKQDQLQKQKDGKGHWKPELASDSEEAVAADRHSHDDHSKGGIEELQKKTADHAEKKHKSGTSHESGL